MPRCDPPVAQALRTQVPTRAFCCARSLICPHTRGGSRDCSRAIPGNSKARPGHDRGESGEGRCTGRRGSSSITKRTRIPVLEVWWMVLPGASDTTGRLPDVFKEVAP
jgi:hypothetical protein